MADTIRFMINRRVAVRAIITNGTELFCVKLKKFPGTESNEGQNFWCTPGGGVDVGEPLIAALEREIIEETGIKPVIGNLLYIQQFQHGDWEHMEFFFHVSNHDNFRSIDLANSTHGYIEIAEASFLNPSSSDVLPEFLRHTNLTEDIASGRTKYFNNFSQPQDN